MKQLLLATFALSVMSLPVLAAPTSSSHHAHTGSSGKGAHHKHFAHHAKKGSGTVSTASQSKLNSELSSKGAGVN